MPQFTVTISDEELKALEWDIADVQEWLDNAIHNAARRLIDQLIEMNTNLNYKKLSKLNKEKEIKKMKLDKAKDRKVPI